MTLPHNHQNGVLARPGLDAEWQELLAQAAGKPWLLKLLAQRGTAIVSRYVLWKQRLTRLRAGERRRLRQRLGVGMAGAALALALMAGPTPAFADTINVDGATCTLADAITAANTNATTGGCTHSGAAGADTLNVTGNIGLTAALPAITTPITIEGNGNTISRSSGTFRILAVTSDGDLTLNSATVSGGIASGSGPARYGGGIYANSANVTVTNSTISGGTAASSGGGIYAKSANVAVTNSTLSGNSASIGGGIVVASSATLSVTNSTLSGNSVVFGGGILAQSASVAVTNSTLSGNSASYFGGGIFAASSAFVTVMNSTLSGNSANYGGGGIFNNGGAVTVQNSIVAAQTAGGDCNTTLTSGGYNIDSDSSCGFTGTGDQQGVSGASLNLKPLANTGGPTNTHALGYASIALDQIPAGTNSCGTTITTDQRGVSRPQDWGTDDSPDACDVGAWEGLPNPPNAVTLAGFEAESGGGGLAGLAAAALAALGLGAVFVRRRNTGATGRSPVRQPQSAAGSAPDLAKSAYQPPAIIHRGQLELRAGSPLALPDFIDPNKPLP